MNIQTHDQTPDWITPKDSEVQLTIYTRLRPRRILWVIVPTDAATVVEEELLRIANEHGKVKLYGEETPPPKPA